MKKSAILTISALSLFLVSIPITFIWGGIWGLTTCGIGWICYYAAKKFYKRERKQ